MVTTSYIQGGGNGPFQYILGEGVQVILAFQEGIVEGGGADRHLTEDVSVLDLTDRAGHILTS